MSKPIFAYDNFMTDYGSVSATSQAVDFEAYNIASWLPNEWWKPTSTGTNDLTFTFAASKTADYVAIFSHNLAEESSDVEIAYYNGSSWVTVASGMSELNSQVIFRTFTAVSSDQWRIRVNNCTLDTVIGIVALGQYTESPIGLEKGFMPPHMAYEDEILNGLSKTGLLIGSSVLSKGNSLNVKLKFINVDWVRSTWDPFIKHAMIKPFFFSWNHSNYPDEAVFCKLDSKIMPPKYSDSVYMEVGIKGMAWHTLRV